MLGFWFAKQIRKGRYTYMGKSLKGKCSGQKKTGINARKWLKIRR